MGGSLVVRVLGGFGVELDGRDVTPASTHQRRLLGALVLADGAAVTTGRLIDVLWGEAPPVSARNALQTYVARLRQVLGADRLVRRADAYALSLTSTWVDAREFTERLRALRRDSEAVVDATAADTTALGLENLLEEWPSESWGDLAEEEAFATDAERLRLLRAQAAELLVDLLLRAGRHADAVERAQRLAAEAGPLDEPAALLLARAVAVSGRVPDALEVLRAHCTALVDELGLDPGPEVRRLEQDLLAGRPVAPPLLRSPPPDPTPAAARSPVGVHATAVTVVGREDDLARLRAALAVSRVVTVVGTGGVGKTTLARHLAAAEPGAVWVDLAVLTRHGDVIPSVAEALGLTPGGDARQAVVAALRASGPTVVLDNCDHVITGAADLAEQALKGPGSRRLLATSRERLDVPGEQVIGLAPLPVPEPSSARPDDPAVRMFVDRLVAAGGPEPGLADAARVVAAVDGLPLAIELAAARAAVVPVEQLLDRLAVGLDVLQGSSRRYGRRHRSLTEVVAWSHDLLPEMHKAVFRRLSVFAGTFTLVDAERVCGGQGLTPRQVSSTLPDLVGCSMVARVDRPTPGFRLLQPLRAFAAEQCAIAGEEAEVAAAQRDRVLTISAAVRIAVPGPYEAKAFAAAGLALDDCRAVHARATADGDRLTVARLTGDLYALAYLQARPDLLAWGEPLADLDPADLEPAPGEPRAGAEVAAREVWARAVATAASGAWLRGDIDRSTRLVDLAAATARGPGARAVVAEVRGDVALAQGDLDAAVRSYAELRRIGRSVDQPAWEGYGAASTAVALAYAGRTEEARREVDDAFELSLRGGSVLAQALAHYAEGELLADLGPAAALTSLAATVRLASRVGATMLEGIARTSDVALRGRAGDAHEALVRYRDALVLWRDAGADGILATTLRNLVVLLARCGADEEALRVDAALSRLGVRDSYGDELVRLDRAVAAARSRFGAAPSPDDVNDLAATADLALSFVETAIEAFAPPTAQ